MRVLTIAMILPAAGCMSIPDAPPGPSIISYETGRCFGACPVYKITLSSDGVGTFEGRQYTAIEGTRNFTVTPQQYADFAARLAPYRPQGSRNIAPGEPGCGNAATDLDGVTVRWNDDADGTDMLNAYYGCQGLAPDMVEALRRAPDALPVGGFITR